jgi:flagellin
MPSIATNTAANSSLFYLNRNSAMQGDSLSKISSGSRIVKASDDAAGAAIAAGLSADISGLETAAQTIQQLDALLQIVDGGLQRVGEILQRMKSLTSQYDSGTLSDTERGFINTEMGQLNTQIDLIADSTTFNGANLMDGTFNQAAVIGSAAANTLQIDLTGVNIAAGAVGEATGDLDAGVTTDIDLVAADRALVGALQSAVNFQGDVVATQIENLQTARSAIADVDIAAEQTRFTNFQVLTEAAIAGLSQANQITQSLLSLLR